jgi:hypothetical protein
MQDGRAITYASRQLQHHEEHYPIHDVEILAVDNALRVYGIISWAVYCTSMPITRV